MYTIGIDLAAQPKTTAACKIEWRDGAADVVSSVSSGIDDDALVHMLGDADKVGIDVPLGWPEHFVDAPCRLGVEASCRCGPVAFETCDPRNRHRQDPRAREQDRHRWAAARTCRRAS